MLLKKKYKGKLKKLDLEPKLKKPILFLLSSHNEDSKQLLKDLYQICKEFSIFRQNKSTNSNLRKNEININNKNHLESEFICNKLGFGLYVVTSSNKKRPISIGFGRIYNQNILDCCQFKVLQYKSTKFFNQSDVDINSRPLIIVQGSGFGQQNGHLITVRNILLDIFKGPNHPKISLDNIKQLITITILDQYNTNTTNTNTNSTTNTNNTHTTTNTTTKENSNKVAAPKGDTLTTGTRFESQSSNPTTNNSTTNNNTNMSIKDGEGVDLGVGLDTVTEKLERRKVYRNGPKILFRRYLIKLLKSNELNELLPKVDLIEIGPCIDFQLEEVLNADPEILKNSIQMVKRPRKLIAGMNSNVKKLKKCKNINSTTLGNLEAKIYIN